MATNDSISLWVRGAISGDRKALERLCAIFEPWVRHHVRTRLPTWAICEDDVFEVAQAVWAVVLPRVPELHPYESGHARMFASYLGRTTVHKCNAFLTRRARDAGREVQPPRPSDSAPGDLDAFGRDTTGIVTQAARRELGSVVADALAHLPEDQRSVLVLRVMEQRTNQEIAELLEIRPNTVAARFRRAKQTLRELLPRTLLDDLSEVFGEPNRDTIDPRRGDGGGHVGGTNDGRPDLCPPGSPGAD